MTSLGIAADVTGHLASKEHGTLGSDLFTDDEPADPDGIIVIHEYTGAPPLWLRDKNTHPAFEYPRLQLVVRGTGYVDVRTRAEAAHSELLDIVDMTIKGIRYGHIRSINSGWMKTRDDRNRFIWKRNYEAIQEAVTPTG